ncbi:hypothetical protein [Nocardioides convexus]|uniref:hypothetical protein n=1 Tax=Nocardioides convexus TaxID=2712224 RepID=UPI0031013028
MVTACASRYVENSHGNWVNPPRSSTIAGTAVARIVVSIATSATLSITEARIGPRSLRSPTLARLIGVVVGEVTTGCNLRPGAGIPRAS